MKKFSYALFLGEAENFLNEPYLIINIMSCCRHGFSWLSIIIWLYRPSHLAGPLGCILCPYRAVVNRFSLVNHHLLVRVKGSTKERRLWVCPYSSYSVLHILFVWFGWFQRWEVGGLTAAVLWDIASRICSI